MPRQTLLDPNNFTIPRSASGSWTRESTQNLPTESLGLTLLSIAHRSGLHSYPCWILPIVPGKDPPPCAKATFRLGRRSNIPPKIIEQIARQVSAGIPTSHGSQYLLIFSWPIISRYKWLRQGFQISKNRVNIYPRDERISQLPTAQPPVIEHIRSCETWVDKQTSNIGNISSLFKFQSFTCDPICTPASPKSWTHLLNSLTARSGACIGSVPKPIH